MPITSLENAVLYENSPPEASGLLDYIDSSLRTGEAIHNRYHLFFSTDYSLELLNHTTKKDCRIVLLVAVQIVKNPFN